MKEPTLEELRYPVGRLEMRPELSPAERAGCVDTVAALPDALRAEVAGLDDERLDTPYRPGGWTVRQVVHHLPDSHMNSYVRFKLAVTEDEPTITTYEEAQWAEMPDAKNGPVELSLQLLEALHDRWIAFLRTLDDAGWRRTFIHPELGKMTLEQLVQVYCWHSRHHLAHITRLKERMGWNRTEEER